MRPSVPAPRSVATRCKDLHARPAELETRLGRRIIEWGTILSSASCLELRQCRCGGRYDESRDACHFESKSNCVAGDGNGGGTVNPGMWQEGFGPGRGSYSSSGGRGARCELHAIGGMEGPGRPHAAGDLL